MKPTLLAAFLMLASSLFGATITTITWSQPGASASSNGYSVTLSPGSGTLEMNMRDYGELTLGTLTVELSNQPETWNVPLTVPFTLNGTEYLLDYAFNAGPSAQQEDGSYGGPWLILLGSGNHDFQVGEVLPDVPLYFRLIGYSGGFLAFGEIPGSRGTSAPLSHYALMTAEYPVPIPEPSTVMLAGAGVGAMVLARLRRRRKVS